MADGTAQGRESVFARNLSSAKQQQAKQDQERPHPPLSRKRERETGDLVQAEGKSSFLPSTQKDEDDEAAR
jgi:hypothetical protein